MVVYCDGTRRYSENSWSVMECNLTWKLQKSLHQPGTPSEAGDATQASSEGTVAATSQTVMCDMCSSHRFLYPDALWILGGYKGRKGLLDFRLFRRKYGFPDDPKIG